MSHIIKTRMKFRICISVPTANDRVIETGVEEVFKMAQERSECLFCDLFIIIVYNATMQNYPLSSYSRSMTSLSRQQPRRVPLIIWTENKCGNTERIKQARLSKTCAFVLGGRRPYPRMG
jgi:hypothetical protein